MRYKCLIKPVQKAVLCAKKAHFDPIRRLYVKTNTVNVTYFLQFCNPIFALGAYTYYEN